MLIDTHCHLNDERLLPELDKIIGGLAADNLWAIINASYDLESSIKSVEIAEGNDAVFATVGTHPHEAITASLAAYDRYAELALSEKVVAIGEIGLDFFYDYSPRETQKKVFLEQLELADALHLPVVLHIRDAYGEALDILKNNKQFLKYGALLHCYGGGAELAREFLKLGCKFSFGGAITFANAKHNVEALKSLPLDAFMLETDCPYMTPVPYRGKVNYPKHLNIVAEKAAEILNVSIDALAAQTNKNALAFFASGAIKEPALM
ncbi:MAG TPA: TatD family hydrolase [Eubacteriales bacterium]|jgi:TatD DNase family protein|nr:TatD family hydrolase [Clostridia bacterium]HRR89307.1 TatD family hydrolase [Eubacteriales bacterium]HRU83827.1 TatD family hydrolase [Eubacteriales bacterium]